MFKIKGIKGVGALRHTGKEKIKVQYDIVIKKLVGFPELNGKTVSLGWKRGSAVNTGTTKEVEVAHGEAVLNEKLMVKSTLFRDPDTDKFDAKDITFSLKQDSKVVAKLTVDLGNYTKNEYTYPVEVPFTKKANAPTLQLSVYTRWVKINGKLLTKPDDKPGIEIDGHAYGLKTDDALTDTSIDTGTGSWEEEDIDKDDPFTSTALYEVESRRTHDEMEALRKQLRLVEGESSQRAKTIELQERELIDLRRQLEVLEKKCAENDELVQRGYNIESFMQQQIALARQEGQDETAALKTAHQNEIFELRKQLETERTRAQLSSLNYTYSTPNSMPTPPIPIAPPEQDPSIVAPEPNQEAENRVRELEGDKGALQQKVDSLLHELDQSAFSLVNMTTKLSEKESRIDELSTQISTLKGQVSTLTASLASSSSSARTTTPTSPRTSSKYKSPSKYIQQPIEHSPERLTLDNPRVLILIFLVLMTLKSFL